MTDIIPWDELAEGYNKTFSTNHACPAKDARLVIRTVIIKDNTRCDNNWGKIGVYIA
jgi:hypothetical protein